MKTPGDTLEIPARLGSSLSSSSGRIWLYAGIVALVGALYGHTLTYPFLFDDAPYLEDNPLIRETGSFLYFLNFKEFLVKTLAIGLPHDLSVNFVLRPVTYATFHLNYLFGGYEPSGYRLVNLAIHAGNGILLYELLTTLLAGPIPGAPLDQASRRFIPIALVFLFLAHPLNTESVTYVAQRFTSLGTFFYLLTAWTYALALAAEDPAKAVRWRSLSFCALLVGMFTKEILFTAPFVLFGIDWVLFGTQARVALKRVARHAMLLPILPAFLWVIAYVQSGGKGLGFEGFLNVANHGAMESDPFAYGCSQFVILIRYLGLVFLPVSLNADPHPTQYEALSDAPVLLAVIFHVSVLAGVLWLGRHRSKSPRRALVVSGVAWFYTTVSIDSSIVPLPDLMADHRTYLPMIGIILVAVAGLDWLRSLPTTHSRWRFAVTGFVTCAVVALSAGTVIRNRVWSSGEALWKDAVAKSPGKWRPWSNLGTHYVLHGRTNEAISCYLEAIRVGPRHIISYQNLQAIMFQQQNYPETIRIGKLAEVRCPPSVYSYLVLANIGASYLLLGDAQQAIFWLESAVNRCPLNGPTQAGLADAYQAVGRLEDAKQRYEFALQLDPTLRTNVGFLKNSTALDEALRARSANR